MNRYLVKMTQIVSLEDLDFDDMHYFGSEEGEVVCTKEIDAMDEEDTLDQFHTMVPIAVIENYSINVEIINE